MPKARVLVREHDVNLDDLPRSMEGLRVVHLSDLHFRRWDRTLKDAQNILYSLDYDLLVVTGDFCSLKRCWRHAAEMTREFFEPLVQRRPVYAVLGNHDVPDFAEMTALPIEWLRNQSRILEFSGGAVELAGIEQCVPRGGDLSATLAGDRGGDVVVLLAHYPSTALRVPKGRVDLVLSGHTHGGQIRPPFVGCLWPNDRIPRILAHGLHRLETTMLHVSSGLGVSFPIRIRINCPPEVAVLKLKTPVKPARRMGLYRQTKEKMQSSSSIV